MRAWGRVGGRLYTQGQDTNSEELGANHPPKLGVWELCPNNFVNNDGVKELSIIDAVLEHNQHKTYKRDTLIE